MRFLLACLLIIGTPLWAEDVVLGLSQDEVSITTDFEGSEILIFGAIKREAPIDHENPIQVIVTVSGPLEPVVVRRKEKKFGIWVNTEAVEVDAAPSFYAISTSAPWRDVISDTEDLRHKISIPRAIRSVGAPMTVTDAQSFSDAVIRIRTHNESYALKEGDVDLRQSTLFNTAIKMPANLTEGDYQTRVFLTRGGEVISNYTTTIDVRKVGLERWLYNLSRQQPLAYGLLSLAIAIAAGWGASAAFRMIRSG